MVRSLLRVLVVLAILLIATVFLCNRLIVGSAEGKTFNTVSALPHNKVGLVLGTAKKLVNGASNPYYTNRIEATVNLFNAGKIDYVLVSGDNGSIYYNEPNTIRNDLVQAGIPKDRIYLDYAGFRTLDSMYRANAIFGLDSVTVISQQFHNERAIYLGEWKNMGVVGLNARDVAPEIGLKVRLREYLARVKVFIDLIFNTQPKFYGERIEIGPEPSDDMYPGQIESGE